MEVYFKIILDKSRVQSFQNCGGVTVQSTDMVICSECCDTDLCSTTLCNQKGIDFQNKLKNKNKQISWNQ